MAVNFLHKRSNTANKRPTAASLDVGELALNYEGGDPGVYFEDDNGDVRKVGPITVGGTAPNFSPATGGSAGNSVGEGWLDTSGTDTVLKIWDGTSWTPAFGGTVATELSDGEIFVGNSSNETEADAFTDVLSAQAGIVSTATSTALTISNAGVIVAGDMDVGNVGLTDASSLAFFELTSNGNDNLTFKAPDNLSGSVNFILPDGDGTTGQRLVTDGSGNLSWASSGAGALTNGNIFVGDASGLAADVSMSGDATIANTGAVTIANDAITTVKILDDAVTGDKIANDVALAGNPTATTQAAGNNSTRIATTAYVDTAAGTKLDTTLNSAEIFVGNGSNEATGVAMSGDTTIDNTGAVTIANDAITTVKILDDNVTGDKIVDDVALAGNPTTTTQASTDNSTRIATTAFVSTAVDEALQGLNSKQSVRAASTGNLTLSGTQTVDGVALSAGERILVKDQTDASENGIYEVAAGAWSRTDDANTWDELVSAFVFVESGTTNADTGWVTQTVAGGTLGTDNIPWTQFSSAGQVTAGAGLTKTGSQIDVVSADASRIVVNADDIDLATTGITAGTYRSVTVDTFGRATAGTNPTTFAGYGISDTSANLASAITDETGTGSLVFASDPALAGTPTAPTAAAGTNSTQIATTAYADNAAGSKLDPALNSGQIFVGNGSNVATGVAMSGDATIDNAGAVTIANDAVTTAKIADDNVTGDKIADDVALAGNPTTTTQAAGTNNTTIATTAYADAAVANIAGTYVDVAGDTMTGPLVLDDTSLQIQEGTDTLTVTAPTLTADRAVTFPDAAGEIALVGAGSVDTRYVAVSGDEMTGNLTMNAQSEIRFADSDSSNFVALEAPATVASDVTFVLPASDGSSGQFLSTNGSGELSFASAGAAALTNGNIFVGNASGAAADVSMSGDTTIDNTGAVTIANDAITTAKILDDAVTGDKIANDVALAGNPTATTQAAGNNSTRIATTAYVDTAAGSKLDTTLNDTQIFVGNGSNVATGVALSGDATIDNTGALTIANDAVTTAKIIDDAVTGDKIADDVALAGNPTATTQAAGNNSTRIATTAYVDTAAGTKLDTTLNDTQIFVGNGSNVATGVAMSGDATIANTGAFTIANDAITSAKIADDSIVNADINSSAAIDYSKMAAMTSASILVGDNSNVPTVTAVSGDVTLSDTGVVDIIDDVNLGGNPTTTTQADTDNSTRIATTAYVHTRVDTAIQGLSSKESVIAASTGNLTLSGTQTVDGQALSAGDRILVKNQTDASENGIYEVAAGAWSRADDANTWDELVGAFVFVEAGTVNASSGFTTTILAGGTLGTDNIPWVQFSGAGQITAGAGMTKTGNTLDVITADASRIVINSNDIDLATTGVAAGTYRSVTTDTYGRITSGTNPTTFAGYGISDTSANLAAAITDETGTGSLVFAGSPALTGTPTAPTQTAGDNSTAIATTAYTDDAVSTLSAAVQWENNSGEIRPTTDGRDVVPVTDGGASLGTTSLRWANVYTQDMHFSNEGTAGNSVDGTTGDWTLQEGSDNLYLINNKTGNKFRISMEPVD